MPLPLLMAAAPAAILLAASPMPEGLPPAFNPYIDAADAAADAQLGGATGQVETFNPVARARVIADQLPRVWSGTYQPFETAPQVPVVLTIDSVRPLGQMVDLRGRMTIASLETPVQGNINAKSDQLDLLLIGDSLNEDLEAGGHFQGLQSLFLSGWMAPRLTDSGGRLQLVPQAPSVAPSGTEEPIRGLW